MTVRACGADVVLTSGTGYDLEQVTASGVSSHTRCTAFMTSCERFGQAIFPWYGWVGPGRILSDRSSPLTQGRASSRQHPIPAEANGSRSLRAEACRKRGHSRIASSPCGGPAGCGQARSRVPPRTDVCGFGEKVKSRICEWQMWEVVEVLV